MGQGIVSLALAAGRALMSVTNDSASRTNTSRRLGYRSQIVMINKQVAQENRGSLVKEAGGGQKARSLQHPALIRMETPG